MTNKPAAPGAEQTLHEMARDAALEIWRGAGGIQAAWPGTHFIEQAITQVALSLTAPLEARIKELTEQLSCIIDRQLRNQELQIENDGLREQNTIINSELFEEKKQRSKAENLRDHYGAENLELKAQHVSALEVIASADKLIIALLLHRKSGSKASAKRVADLVTEYEAKSGMKDTLIGEGQP